MGPALLLATVNGSGLLVLAGIGIGIVGIVVLRQPLLHRVSFLALPVALSLVGLPALSPSGGVLGALLGGISGVGLLLWLGRTSGVPSGRGAWLAALSGPALSVVAAFAIAVSTPGFTGGPGVAALLLVSALVLIGVLLASSAPEEVELPDLTLEGTPTG
jgi:peptidoglycan biosynthesis protein MviN/MurJ (putative lipid II flippase)